MHMQILFHLHDTCVCSPTKCGPNPLECSLHLWPQVPNNTLPQLVSSLPASWLAAVAPVAPVDCILVRRLANALNSPLLQSTASETKCSSSSVSRRVSAYARAFLVSFSRLLRPPPGRCAAVTAVAHAVQPVALSFRI